MNSAAGLLNGVNYLRLEEAANRISVSACDLLNLGVQGKVSIWAPVLNAGVYEWIPSGTENILDFPHDAEFFREFDIKDYVIVPRKNLAEISVNGKTSIKSFMAPVQASATFHLKWGELHESGRTPINIEQFDIDYTGDPEKPCNDEEVMALSVAVQNYLSSIEADRELLQVAFQDPWEFARIVDSPREVQNTTISHLFMSVNDVNRIVSQSPNIKSSGVQVRWTDDVIEEMIRIRTEKGTKVVENIYKVKRQRLDTVTKEYKERKEKETPFLKEKRK